MTSSVFLDINVWLALSSRDHRHFETAWAWYKRLPPRTSLLFCRFTQLGLLRLLTTRAAMGQGTLAQAQAWQAYDRWIEFGGAEFAEEKAGIELRFRNHSNSSEVSPKEWADAYMAAFSEAAGITLVTFDRALAGKVKGAAVLG